MGKPTLLPRLLLTTSLLAWFVIMLGAYVRLSDAGLGCPDWPGCFGQLVAPMTPEMQSRALAAYPDQSIDVAKAWKEMAHRYAAGVLGILVLSIAVLAWRARPARPLGAALPYVLLGVVIVQALFGMWTVTLLLKPAVVTLHLLGGMLTLALLIWLTLRASGDRITITDDNPRPSARRVRPLAMAALLVLVIQIALGGWTSTNYAAFFCPDFPTCQGQWLPELDFDEGFTLWRSGDRNYEGGLLSNAAGTAVHFAHRLGALATLIVLSSLGIVLIRGRYSPSSTLLGALLCAAVAAQVGLGIANVLLRLPLSLAVAHNALAAVLLVIMVTLVYLLRSKRSIAPETV